MLRAYVRELQETNPQQHNCQDRVSIEANYDSTKEYSMRIFVSLGPLKLDSKQVEIEKQQSQWDMVFTQNRWMIWSFKGIPLHICGVTGKVPEFQKAMEKLKEFSKEAYEWLNLIPPQHWSRSHFSGINMCEVFNGEALVGGRDKPIILTKDVCPGIFD
ncbi:hypothetical protein Tco_0615278 [Tanacetum coccineum]